MSHELELCFDGSCWPNPGGTATWGFVLTGPVGLDMRESGVVKHPAPTNNVAEWAALWMGLSYIADYPPRTPGLTLVIRGDSQLVLNQLTGRWRCHKPWLAAIRDRCLALLDGLGLEWSAQWTPREENTEADALTREAWEWHTGEPFAEAPAWQRLRA
jgi:ribonuclease HI